MPLPCFPAKRPAATFGDDEDEELYGVGPGNTTDGTAKQTAGGLGWLAGVYIPTMNSVFGVVVFLRWGFAVGNVGMSQVFAMLLIGCSVALLTTMSVSTISTNQTVQAGGPYFMLSRSAGIELGGSLGILFFVSQTLGIGFYTLGFSETISSYVFEHTGTKLPVLYLALLTITCVFLLSMIGSDFFARLSTGILAVILLALILGICSFLFRPPVESLGFTGLSAVTFQSNLYAPEPGVTKWGFLGVFGVVYPSMTAILTGANMSGSLANASHAIPLGTAASVATMIVSYVIIIVINGAGVYPETLRTNYFILQDVCIWPPAVLIGTLFATFSSALSGLVGTAKVWQAMAKDKLFPGMVFFAKEVKGEPRRAIIFTYILAVGPLFLGEVNAIAPLLTNFVLVTFAGLNFACFLLYVSHTPNFRPGFKHSNWKISIVGFIECIIVMFLIDVAQAGFTILIAIIIGTFLYIRPPRGADWGRISQALLFRFVMSYLIRLDVRKSHVKFWRPQVLLMCSDVTKTSGILKVGADMCKRGLFVVGHVLVGHPADDNITAMLEPLRSLALRNILDVHGLRALVELTIAPAISLGMANLAMIAGMSSMKPNTVLMGLPFAETVQASLDDARDREAGVVREVPVVLGARGRPPRGTAAQLVDWLVTLQSVQALGRNLAICTNEGTFDRAALLGQAESRLHSHGESSKIKTTIDVWLTALELDTLANGSTDSEDVEVRQAMARTMVLLQLAFVFLSNRFWRSSCRLRLLVLARVQTVAERKAMKKQMEILLNKCRIVALVRIVCITDLNFGAPADEDEALTQPAPEYANGHGDEEEGRFQKVGDYEAGEEEEEAQAEHETATENGDVELSKDDVNGAGVRHRNGGGAGSGADGDANGGIELTLHAGSSKPSKPKPTVVSLPETPTRAADGRELTEEEKQDRFQRDFDLFSIEQRFSLFNRLIKRNANGAVIQFLNVALEPRHMMRTPESTAEYITRLRILTEGLSPTLIVFPGVEQIAVVD